MKVTREDHNCQSCFPCYTTECDSCHKECNIGDMGNSIAVVFPYGHPLDNVDGENHFCSTECLIKYIEQMTEEVKTEEGKAR